MNTIPGYMAVQQHVGACSATDIAGYITNCDSTTATNTTCNAWFNGDASTACQNCIIGPVTGSDPGIATGTGGTWIDYYQQNIGANQPGCLDKEGMSACATAWQNFVECIFSAGCYQCQDQTTFNSCESTVAGNGGGCHSYIAPVQNSCGTDLADGGLINGGPCTTDTQILSVLCGNGSGDGG